MTCYRNMSVQLCHLKALFEKTCLSLRYVLCAQWLLSQLVDILSPVKCSVAEFCYFSDWLKNLIKSRLGSITWQKMVSLHCNAHKGLGFLCIFGSVAASGTGPILAWPTKLFILFSIFYNCIVSMGFLPWEIWVASPGESQLRQSRNPNYGAC